MKDDFAAVLYALQWCRAGHATQVSLESSSLCDFMKSDIYDYNVWTVVLEFLNFYKKLPEYKGYVLYHSFNKRIVIRKSLRNMYLYIADDEKYLEKKEKQLSMAFKNVGNIL